MARRKRSTAKRDSEDDGHALPSSPSRPPTVNVWLKYGDGFSRLQIHCFCARWAAWDALAIALNDREYKKLDDFGWYETEDESLRFRLVGDVKKLLSEKPSRNWVPPNPTLSQLQKLAGTYVEPEREPEEAPKRRATKRSASVSRDGLTTLGELCKELGMEPRDARKTLRGKVEKPDAGWAWPDDELDDIRKLLK